MPPTRKNGPKGTSGTSGSGARGSVGRLRAESGARGAGGGEDRESLHLRVIGPDVPESAAAPLVTFTFDGDEITAPLGMPLAAALASANQLQLARSPKFHRPRGPACMRGACDGCLVRVDGEPNVLSCLTPVTANAKVESQNTLGTRNIDLLRMTDWFFPEGMNHHELLAGVPGLSNIMQLFARRVAGLGKMPEHVVAEKTAARREVDVLVVGAGPSGLAIATELAARGRHVTLVDDAVHRGGSLRALSKTLYAPFAALVNASRRAEKKGEIVVRERTTVGGIFGDDALVVGPNGAEVLHAKALVLAPGSHDGVLAFEGNDVPGVMSARALGTMLALGVAPGSKIAIFDCGAGGVFSESARELASVLSLNVVVVEAEPLRANGASHVRSIVARDARGKEKEVSCDIAAIDAPTAPAYELCEQAGATLKHESRGYVVTTDAGRIRDGIWALGEVCGTPFDADAISNEARAVAAAITRA